LILLCAAIAVKLNYSQHSDKTSRLGCQICGTDGATVIVSCSHCGLSRNNIALDDNDMCVQLVMRHQGDGATGSALARIRYITQVKSRPPTFAVFVSGGLDFPENARRFLIKALQKDFEFEGVPIRAEIRYRKRKQMQDNQGARQWQQISNHQ
jgi:hypothetical protein